MSNPKLLLSSPYHKGKQVSISKQLSVSQRGTSPCIRAIIPKFQLSSRIKKGSKSLHQDDIFQISIELLVLQRGTSPYIKTTSRTIKRNKSLLELGSSYKGDHAPDQGVKSQIITGLLIPQRGTSPYIRAASRIIKGNKSLHQGDNSQIPIGFPYQKGKQIPTSGRHLSNFY